MTDPDALAAVDPATPLDQLARIANERPDLRATVAANPSTYDALLDWLAAFHDPQVDAVLALRRRPTAPPPGPPVQVMYGAAPYVAHAPLSRAKFVEPMRSLHLRWSTYTARYAVGLALLAFAGLFPFFIVYPLDYSSVYAMVYNFDLANIIQRVVTSALAAVGIAVFPTTIARRIVAAVIVAIALPIDYSELWQTLHDTFGYLSPQFYMWLLVVLLAETGGSVAVWLVLRGRPGATYLLAVAAGLIHFGFVVLSIALSLQGVVANGSEAVVSGVATVAAIWLARAIHASRRPRAL